ncbi:MAG: adenylate/guanylate cyclase domain-containing protein [Proteobacteria bacterium]|nr:adenylate/guanylate cyclase domain-containing protein [Pseudomonadota bacterium]
MKLSNILAATAAALVVGGIFAAPALDRVENISLDSLFWLRHAVWGQRHAPQESPSVVIAIDEETYRTAPFRDVPKVMWTKQIGTVVDGVREAGAAVIGFDIILPTSVATLDRNYDREFMLALRRAAQENKIVLAKVQHQVKPIAPYAGHSSAVDHQRNIRSVNLYGDADGVIRRAPLFLDAANTDGTLRKEPSLSLELAARQAGEAPRVDGENGDVFLGDYSIPGGRENALSVNFDGGASIPTYSLADIHACVAAGQQNFLSDHFAGKAVLLGVVLDVEDRKITSKRFITAPEGDVVGARCALPAPGDLYKTAFTRDSIPGVYIHAAAINNLLRGDALRMPARIWNSLITVAFTLLVAGLAMRFEAWRAGLAILGCGFVWLIVATTLFRSGLVLPLFDPLIAGALTFAVLLGYRFAVSDKDKRRLRHAFTLYLAPALVDRMVERGKAPELGGENRELTVLFSDIEGFTSVSEQLSPEQLVAGLNIYLSEMTDIIEDHGGFVDKYIGDAIVAVFGAPLEDADHARNGVTAALACRDRLAEMPRVFQGRPDLTLRARIGLNSGDMLVGNMGSRRRFNYTVMGDAVNLAARLEGANKAFGSQILVSETTARACGDSIAMRELDLIRVVGREAPIAVYEPLCLAAQSDAAVTDRITAFATALALYRRREFEAAAIALEALEPGDSAAAKLAVRARGMISNPPPADWQGINELVEK